MQGTVDLPTDADIGETIGPQAFLDAGMIPDDGKDDTVAFQQVLDQNGACLLPMFLLCLADHKDGIFCLVPWAIGKVRQDTPAPTRSLGSDWRLKSTSIHLYYCLKVRFRASKLRLLSG